MEYRAEIDLSNRNNSHTLAFNFIQQMASGRVLTILEVGCSSGYFGEALVREGHEVWGIEPVNDAIEQARGKLTNIFEGSVDEFFDKFGEIRFDVIVFGDVLEHLPNPEKILGRCKYFLKDGGAIVASVPNIAHLAIRAMLLEGRWDYSDMGIMDRTHLRFFTRTTLVNLFSNASYQVLKISPVRLLAEHVNELYKLNLSAEILAKVTGLVMDDCAYDFQYVVLARPVLDANTANELNSLIMNDTGVRVVCIVPDPDCSLVDIRLRMPLERWAEKNSCSVKFVSIYGYTQDDLEWGDVYVFQRNVAAYDISLIDYLKSQNKKVVFEIDDLLLNLPPFLSHHKPGISKKHIIKAIGLSDAVSVSTVRLGNQLASYNTKIYLTPNCSEHLTKVAKQSAVTSEKVTLIVASSDRVLVDFIAPALKIAQELLGVRIIAIGPLSERLAEAGVVVQKINNLPYHKFKSFIASVDNGIGIIPLDDSPFSSCKSAVKYFGSS